MFFKKALPTDFQILISVAGVTMILFSPIIEINTLVNRLAPTVIIYFWFVI